MERSSLHASGEEFVWKRIAFFLLTLFVLFVCALLLYPFLTAIVIAIVLGVVTQRPHEWLASKVRNRTASSALMLLAVIMSVIVPGFFLAEEFGRQLISLAASLQQESTQSKIADFLSSHPGLIVQVQNMTTGVDLNNAARTAALFVGGKLAQLLGHSILTITQIVIMLVLLFFLYRDSDQAMTFARTLIPLDERETDDLLRRCTDTIYATVLGRFVVAGVQGTLSGLAYWLLGVPGALLWAVLTLVMAMIPAFGAVIIWAPIAVYLGLTGHWGKAALLAAWGGGVVSLIDNILYPVVVGTHLRQHTAAILLSILGGVALFGLTGIILGPLSFTIAGALLQFWQQRAVESS
jgi:predicted PurR-regulated permease PerM